MNPWVGRERVGKCARARSSWSTSVQNPDRPRSVARWVISDRVEIHNDKDTAYLFRFCRSQAKPPEESSAPSMERANSFTKASFQDSRGTASRPRPNRKLCLRGELQKLLFRESCSFSTECFDSNSVEEKQAPASTVGRQSCTPSCCWKAIVRVCIGKQNISSCTLIANETFFLFASSTKKIAAAGKRQGLMVS